MKVASQPEEMVADDLSGKLYVGEEIKGIWVFEAVADGGNKGIFSAQDGANYSVNGEAEAQNFKILSWKQIEEAIFSPLPWLLPTDVFGIYP